MLSSLSLSLRGRVVMTGTLEESGECVWARHLRKVIVSVRRLLAIGFKTLSWRKFVLSSKLLTQVFLCQELMKKVLILSKMSLVFLEEEELQLQYSGICDQIVYRRCPLKGWSRVFSWRGLCASLKRNQTCIALYGMQGRGGVGDKIRL